MVDAPTLSGLRVYRADDLADWDPTKGLPDAPQVETTGAGLERHPVSNAFPNFLMKGAEPGDYAIVSRFSSIDEPTFARSDFTVEPGMDWVVEAVAGIAYIEPDMMTEAGEEFSTGSGSIRDPQTGERLSYGYTTRKYFPIVNGERGDKSAVSGKQGPIPAGEYEMVLQVGAVAHRERITLEPGDDYRPKVTIGPIVTARLDVIGESGSNVNDGLRTYVTTCAIQPRDAEGNLTGCGAAGSTGTGYDRKGTGSIFVSPGRQVIAFQNTYENVVASKVIDVPDDATADTFTITMRAGKKADVGQVEGEEVEPGIEEARNGATGVGQTDAPDPAPAPPPGFDELETPVPPARVFLRIRDGSPDGLLLNDSTYRRPTSEGDYLGTWIYRARDLVSPGDSTQPLTSDRGTAREPIPAEFGGDGSADPAAYPTIATDGALAAGDYVAVSSFWADDERVNVMTPFGVMPGTEPIVDLPLGEVPDEPSEPVEREGPPSFANGTAFTGASDPAPVPEVQPVPLPFEEPAEEAGGGQQSVALDPAIDDGPDRPTGLPNPMLEPDPLAPPGDGAVADVFVRVTGPDGLPILTPYSIVLCEDRPRDAEGRLQGCGEEAGNREPLAVPTGRPVVIGAWDGESFGASKVFTVSGSASGGAHEVVLESTERAYASE